MEFQEEEEDMWGRRETRISVGGMVLMECWENVVSGKKDEDSTAM